ncbi:MAG TPA: hypothetical protein VF618_16815 [Thermoanaerobaculia bacterium]
MEADFQKALTVVFVVGGFVAVVGTTVLYFAFRAFGNEKKEKVSTAVILTVATLVFVFVFCFIFLLWAMRGAR